MRRVALLLFLCALPISAQDAAPEQRRPWWKSKQFWISTAIVAGVAIADAEATHRCLRRDPLCRETNPLLGTRRPSRGRMYLVGGLSIVAERAVVAAVWRRSEGAGKTLAWWATGVRVVFHASHAAQAQPRACPANGAGC